MNITYSVTQEGEVFIEFPDGNTLTIPARHPVAISVRSARSQRSSDKFVRQYLEKISA